MKSTGKRKNWVEQQGGLPRKIKSIARKVRQKNPEMEEGHSIAIAVNSVERMCNSGDTNFPGIQQVMPQNRSEACAALAEWEKKKAAARADN